MNDPHADERWFQLLVDSVTEYAIYRMDAEGRVATWNPAAERVKGYTLDEIRGQPFSRFFTLEDRNAGVPERLLETARREGRVNTEGWRLRKDGSRFWAMGTVHALKDESGRFMGFAKITRDMTEQREAQQALLESERRFRLLVEGVIDYAIYMLNTDGAVTNWNRGAERIKGYRAEDVVGRHFSMFYTPRDRAAGLPARALNTALKEGRFEAEGWRLRKDGSCFFASVVIDPIFDDDGRHIGYAKITRDISERRAADEALAQSERQFRLMVSNVVDYALFMLDPNGIVTNWNAGAQAIKGYTSDEIVGQHMSRFYTEPDRAAGMPLKALYTAAETGRFETEAWRVRKDGSLFWAHVVIDAIRDETGQLAGFAKITRDLTEKREAQAEIDRAHEQLAQSQKMEALGQLTGGVAHDFNNLLMVVSGHAQLLRKRVGDNAAARRSLDAIEHSARRGEDLTRHLLAFARRQRLQSDAVDLPEREEALKELIGASLSGSIDVAVSLPPELWPVEVDLGELELAILNLVVNARDAMPKGGSVSIVAENQVLTGKGPGDLTGDFVMLTVADTGVGIPDDILPRVIDPFFTTKEVGKGTGLGLSQVYGFAQQSGGTLTVHSELGRGTRVTIYLPRAADRPQRQSAREEGVAPEASGASILVVEDNPEVAEVAAGLLDQLGHRVRIVGNADAALKALQEDEAVDLVFSDVVMAGEMDGVDLARSLRAENPTLPILLATGYSGATEGVGDEFPVLRKPYKLEELGRAVNTLLAGGGDDAPGGNLVKLDRVRAARRQGST